MMDLIIRNALVPCDAWTECVDIGIQDGMIVAIEKGLAAEGEAYNAGHRLVCGGLVETHIHLDKAYLIEQCPALPGRDISPVPYTSSIKPKLSTEEVYGRAERALKECLMRGTTHIRTHVEVDPVIGMRGFDAIEKLKADYRWAADIQICVFPQDGLTNLPGTEELIVQGLRRGANLIGAAPRYDTDAKAQILRIFELAREFDVDIDMHLDVGPTADHLDIYDVIELTKRHGLGGRVTVGHMAKLSLLPPAELEKVGARLADAGINVTVLPATDLFLMGRKHDHAVHRGVADANFLVKCGVNCSISSNNIMNPSTPYGDCSLIRIANLQANVLQVALPHELAECFHMITDRSARILNIGNYGVEVGNPADIVVIDAPSPEKAVAEIRQPVAVFKRGRRTVAWDLPQLLQPASA
jgi:cytosine/creatinine deaminase